MEEEETELNIACLHTETKKTEIPSPYKVLSTSALWVNKNKLSCCKSLGNSWRLMHLNGIYTKHGPCHLRSSRGGRWPIRYAFLCRSTPS